MKQQKQQLEDSKDEVRTEVVMFKKDHETLVMDTVDSKKCGGYGSKEKLLQIRVVRGKEE